MKTLYLFLICIPLCHCQWNWVWVPYNDMHRNDKNSSLLITNLTSDIIKDTDEKIRAIETIRLATFRSVAYEVGFTNYVIVEEYRKLIDKYNTAISMGGELYAMEFILYLVEIEAHYWQIDHLCNMQHEIERKYRVQSKLKAPPVEAEMYDFTPDFETKTKKHRQTRDRLGEQIQIMLDRLQTTKKRSTRWWWPIEYGWEIDYYW